MDGGYRQLQAPGRHGEQKAERTPELVWVFLVLPRI
jgi:hypothetical protein